MEDQLKAALPAHIPVERFARVIMTAVQINPELLECERRSLWNSALRAANDGLVPDGREGAMVVRRDSQRGKLAVWMPMILGVRKKARNSGEISSWDAHIVCAGDHFEFQLGDNPQVHHAYNLRAERGQIIGAYSVCVLKDGTKSYEVMSIAEIHKVRDRSDGWRAYKAGKIKSTPWSTDEGEMARKTVARRHSKVLPMSADLDDLVRRDDDDLDAGDARQEPERERPRSLVHKLDVLASPPETPATPAPKARARKPAAGTSPDDPLPPGDHPPADAIASDVEDISEAPAEQPGETAAGSGAPAEPPAPAEIRPPVSTAADRKRLREYHRVLEGALTKEKLSKVSADFWKGEVPEDGTPLRAGMVAILGAHARRLNSEGSIADADNVAREWIGPPS
jgi:recombination protein RecT